MNGSLKFYLENAFISETERRRIVICFLSILEKLFKQFNQT